MNLPDTIFGEKVHYWTTRSIAECREHADNFVVIFANTEEYKHATGMKIAERYDSTLPVAVWYEDGKFDGWGHFDEDFEEYYSYKDDFGPYVFFVYISKTQII